MERIQAAIERGQIKTVSDEGYVVTSLDREGIESQPITAINSNTYSEGDKVYFFVFPDGTGKIISGW